MPNILDTSTACNGVTIIPFTSFSLYKTPSILESLKSILFNFVSQKFTLSKLHKLYSTLVNSSLWKYAPKKLQFINLVFLIFEFE